MEIWFGIANAQISSTYDSYLPATCPYFCFRMIIWVNISRFSPCALILWRSGFGLLMGKFCQFLTGVICSLYDSGRVFHVFILNMNSGGALITSDQSSGCHIVIIFRPAFAKITGNCHPKCLPWPDYGKTFKQLLFWNHKAIWSQITHVASYLTLVLLNQDMPCLCKQWRSRSVGFSWSGSTLFVIKYVNLYQQPGSRYLIGWKLKVDVAS